MSKILRYEHCVADDGDGRIDEWDSECKDGEWVKYDDHAAEVARLTAERDAAYKQRNGIGAELDRYIVERDAAVQKARGDMAEEAIDVMCKACTAFGNKCNYQERCMHVSAIRAAAQQHTATPAKDEAK